MNIKNGMGIISAYGSVQNNISIKLFKSSLSLGFVSLKGSGVNYYIISKICLFQ